MSYRCPNCGSVGNFIFRGIKCDIAHAEGVPFGDTEYAREIYYDSIDNYTQEIEDGECLDCGETSPFEAWEWVSD